MTDHSDEGLPPGYLQEQVQKDRMVAELDGRGAPRGAMVPASTTYPRIKTGIYLATFHAGGTRPVAIFPGPTHRMAMIPVDGRSIITEIVEDNWRGVVATLTPLREQGGLSGAMYWDTDSIITLEAS